MKTINNRPGAKRLMGSLRDMGYSCSTAIADLVDNSITAKASEIRIDILREDTGQPAAIVIADNGIGMDKDQLQEAMRFGALQEYEAESLGKYGLGLKTASLSQCRVLTVSSKAKPNRGSRPHRHNMRWDLDHVYKTDEWELLVPSSDEFHPWEIEVLNKAQLGDHGTIVLWSGLDSLPLLAHGTDKSREKFLSELIDEVGGHLRMVFHRFMEGVVRGHRKVTITLCGVPLEPWDPFCRTEDTRQLEILRLPVECKNADGIRITDDIIVSPYILPREDEFQSREAWKDASGPKKWNQQQGFYFYRNNRLLQAGGWNGIRARDEHSKLLRVAIDFNESLDSAFAINITKMKARVPAEIKAALSEQVKPWAREAMSRYGSKTEKNEQPTRSKSLLRMPFFSNNDQISIDTEKPADVSFGPLKFIQGEALGSLAIKKDGGKYIVSVPRNHDAWQVFSYTGDSTDQLKKLCLSIMSILEAVEDGQIASNEIPINEFKKLFRKIV